MTNNPTYHTPVMLQECLEALQLQADGTYVDVTFGGGGHSRAIFDQLSPKGQLIAFDQDADARKNAWEAENFHFVAGNFAFFANHLKMMGIGKVDGILADLGVSSHQIDEPTRGFTFRAEAKLDMRMNRNSERTAADILNTYEESDLIRMFRTFGEIKNSGKLTRDILLARSNKKLRTTGQLLEILDRNAPKFKEHKYYAQVFQALRIEVNEEMQVLESFLEQCTQALRPGGRLVVMSYHSLEDRMVKNFMKRGSISGTIEKDFYGNVLKDFSEVIRHPLTASEEEISQNNRARSAKLRIAERNG
ncbi:MAG: 16S rRNA (cytosine(1402)-N(4))-methyltransferase [Bacteroidetes bacterium RIFCSPHIGHO2_02_FULL_44_7]|nr:MAG: 16S rRNA (cytosine(1402)-N(4))-methyltransferase [Bacteroidetes bacterium RIFCSPHIGHO2_02_FULL_44_7]